MFNAPFQAVTKSLPSCHAAVRQPNITFRLSATRLRSYAICAETVSTSSVNSDRVVQFKRSREQPEHHKHKYNNTFTNVDNSNTYLSGVEFTIVNFHIHIYLILNDK